MDLLVIIPAVILAGIALYNIRRANRAEAALARVEATIGECEKTVTR